MSSTRRKHEISAVVVQYGRTDLPKKLLRSLAVHPDRGLISEVIVVDNDGSIRDDVADDLAAAAAPIGVRVIRNPDSSYSSGVNLGVGESGGELLLIMNNDLEWKQQASIRSVTEAVTEPGVGIVAPQLVFADGAWQRSYGPFPSIRSAVESLLLLDTARNLLAARRFRRGVESGPSPVDYVDGAFMCVRRECFEKLGGFDESFAFYGEDVDFCFRARLAGWSVLLDPRSRIVHLRGASSSRRSVTEYSNRLMEARIRFLTKHFGSRRARLYSGLHRFALWVRSTVYGWVAGLSRSEKSRERAQAARLRYVGVKSGTAPRDRSG